MKTDLSASTVRFRSLPGADLTALLSEHRRLVERVAAAHGGRIVVEKILDRLSNLVDALCRDFDGVRRMTAGDSYCLTFEDLKLALGAVDRLAEEWHAPGRPEAARCSLSNLNVAMAIERVLSRRAPRDAYAHRMDVEPSEPRLKGIEIHLLVRRGAA